MTSARDMNSMSEKCKLFKELYEKEAAQKQLLLKKLKSGKLKIKPPKDAQDTSKKKKKKRSRTALSRRSEEETSAAEITYLSSPESES